MLIEVASILELSEVNGPGRRSVLWVQGCPKRCKGCFNPEFIPFGSKWKISPEEAVKLLTQDESIEGITFSGGEPFAQALALTECAKLLRAKNLSIFAYSGYTIEEIKNFGNPYTDLLEQLDILVDGEYIEELSANLLWRGSSNQRVHFLTDRYIHLKDNIYKPIKEIEIIIKPSEVIFTGFPE